MSKGLGKIEMRILDVLKIWEPKHKDTRIRVYSKGMPLGEMARFAQDMTLNVGGDYPFAEVPNSIFKATCRAAHSLQRKGLVQITDVQMTYFERGSHDTRGGASHCKSVRLNVESNAKGDCSQHLQEVTV